MFDIIIPVYNTKVEYLEDCLNSVINQSCPEWNCYIVNGTPDDSERYDEIHTYLESMCVSDKRIDYYINESQLTDTSNQRNMAIARGVNPYIVLLDSDDYLTSNWLEILQRKINGAYSIYYGINRTEQIFKFRSRKEIVIADFNRYSCSFLIPKELKGMFHSLIAYRTVGLCVTRKDTEACGGFDKKYGILEDGEFLRKIHEGIGHEEGKRDSLYIPEISGYIRMHEEQWTKSDPKWGGGEEHLELDRVLKEKYPHPIRESRPPHISEEFWEWFMDMLEFRRDALTKVYIETIKLDDLSQWGEFLTPEEDDSIYD